MVHTQYSTNIISSPGQRDSSRGGLRLAQRVPGDYNALSQKEGGAIHFLEQADAGMKGSLDHLESSKDMTGKTTSKPHEQSRLAFSFR